MKMCIKMKTINKKSPLVLRMVLQTSQSFLAWIAVFCFTLCLSDLVDNAIVMGASGSVIETSKKIEAPTKGFCTSEICQEASKRIRERMNLSADPCSNFHEFACGGWVKKEKRLNYYAIKDMGVRIKIKVEKLFEKMKRNDKSVLTDYPRLKKLAAKMLQFHKICMDHKTIPIRQRLKEILSHIPLPLVNPLDWENTDIEGLVADLQLLGVKILVVVAFDRKETGKLFVGLPNKHQRGKLMKMNSAKRQNHIRIVHQILSKVYEDLGIANVTIDGNAIFQLHSMITERTQMQNYSKINSHKTLLNVSEWKFQMNYFDFKKYFDRKFSKFNLTLPEDILVDTRYFRYVNEILHELSDKLPNLKETFGQLAIVELIKRYEDTLTKDYRDLFTRYKRSFPYHRYFFRWSQDDICYQGVRFAYFSDLITRFYLEEHFDRRAPKDIKKMVKIIRGALFDRLKNLSWIDEETDARLFRKLESIKVKVIIPKDMNNISYLEKKYDWIDFSITSYIKFTIMHRKRRTRQFYFDYLRGKRRSFSLKSLAVNAHFSKALNRINIAPGLLQWPAYDLQYPKFVNFGGLGSILGHEYGHALTVALNKVYANSQSYNLSAMRKEKLTDTEDCFEDQYSSYKGPPDTGKPLPGLQFKAEAVVDSIGLDLAFEAYRRWINDNGKELPLSGLNFTPDQSFFISFAQINCMTKWKSNGWFTSKRDRHPPPYYRVINPLSQYKSFTEAFQCRDGEKMKLTDSCNMW